MTYNSLVNFDLIPSVVQTTDGTTTVTILSTPAFGHNDSGSQIVTFDITGYEATYQEVVTAKVCVKIINNSGTPAMVGTPVHLIPVAVGSSTNLQTAAIDVVIAGTDLHVNVIGVAGKTINWICSRFPSLQLINGLPAATLSDGYVMQWDDGYDRWTPDSVYNVVGALGGDLSGTLPNPTVVGIQGKDLDSAIASVSSTQDGYALTWVNANNQWEAKPVNELGPPSAGGDLSGTYPNPTVAKVNGSTVPAGGSLTTGNVLQVSGSSALTYGAVNLAGGSNYVTGTLPAGNQAAQTLGGDLSGTTSSATVTKIQNNLVDSASPSNNDLLKWTTSGTPRWLPTARETVTEGISVSGDLTGTLNSPTVYGIQGHVVNNNVDLTQAATDGYVLTWSQPDAYWRPEPSSFTAGGDLSGTATNQKVVGISGNAGTVTVTATNFTPPVTQLTIGGLTGVLSNSAPNPNWISMDGYHTEYFANRVETSFTAATIIYTQTTSSNTSYVLKAFWVARDNTDTDKTSSGEFKITIHNKSGTVTVSSVDTIGTNYNTGASGAAAATPITTTISGTSVQIKVTAQSSNVTRWVMDVKYLAL